MIKDEKSYMTDKRECDIENSIDRIILHRTIRIFFKRGAISCINFTKISFEPSHLKLLSSGMKYTKIKDLKIIDCAFSNISLVKLNDMLSNIQMVEIKGLDILTFREREAFALMIKDLEKSWTKARKQAIFISTNRKVYWGEELKKGKNLIQIHLAGFERNNYKFLECKLDFEFNFHVYPEPDFLLKIFKERVSFTRLGYNYISFSDIFRYLT